MYTALKEFLKQNNISFVCDEPMSRHTTFKIGGNADVFVFIKTEETLSRFLRFLNDQNIPLFIIGKGSNLLVGDKGIRGVVVSLEERKEITLCDNLITAQSGASLLSLCTFAAQNGLAGLEFAYGIPASVGGALYMNAGAYGGEMKDVVVSAECMDKDGNLFVLSKEQMELSYRKSIFKNKNYIILSVCFKLKNGDVNEIKENMNGYFARRKEKQPLEYPSAGSTFKRPEGYFAGALIQQSNLKGQSVGGAQVSEKHAGFVINKDGASCADVTSLIQKIKDTVYKDSGVALETEVIFIGEN